MTDFTRLVAAMADRYRIERKVGQGGMATVYLAQDLKHDRKVAVKVLRPELAAVIGAERFLSEIKTTANLQHPHILTLHDSGEADTFLYYVMPFIEGESLRDRLTREKQLPVHEAVRIATEVASALDYAHRHGVIHRDIKPENILLHDGRALVADFGIALAASKAGNSRITETGMSLGTPRYMSPEQAMGERELTARSDVYSLGVVTYEMLLGDPPFIGATAQSIVAKVVHEEPRPLAPIRHTIPSHVEEAVLIALEKLPADRFATASEFASALESASGSRITRARAGVAIARARGQLWLAGLSGLAVGALAAFLGWRLAGPSSKSPGVSRQRIVLWDKPASERASLAVTVDISADGGLIVYLDSVDGGRQLFLKRRNQANAVAIPGTINALGPFFSPDSRWIGFTADGKIKKVPLEGGAPTTIADSAAGYTTAWLDDGTIVFVDLKRNLRRVSERGGSVETLVDLADSLSMGVAFPTSIPGGQQLIYTTCTAYCSQSSVRILDLQTRQSHELIPGGLKAWYVAGGYLVYLRAGGAMISRFDSDEGRLHDGAVPVIDNVQLVDGEPDLIIARNGTALYVEGSQARSDLEPIWVSRDGRVSQADSGWAFHYQAGNEGIALSPDGRRLAFAMPVEGGQSEIWIKQLDGGGVSRLTFGGINYRPEWTWDGGSVLFIGDGKVHSRRADGSAPAQVMRHASRQVSEAQMTPDGSWILRLAAPPSRDIWMTAPGDTTPRPLVADDRFEETSARISPDGKWLVYASDESGRSEVYVRPFPNVSDGRWQVSSAGGDEPVWAHSGRELFYRDAARNLVAVAVGPGGTVFASRGERTLFPSGEYVSWQFHRAYDVGPGDDRFLMIRKTSQPVEGGRRDLILVEGWLEELKSAVGQ